jgi:murein DD-endopeptidase MepM/ murein hydrolase activator NlpD
VTARPPAGQSRFLSVIVVPDDGRESRTFRISYRTIKVAAVGVLLTGFALTTMAGSWWYLAARAGRVSALEEMVAAHESDRGRVEELGAKLEELEARYQQIRRLFGTEGSDATSDLWLPPPAPSAPRGPAPNAEPEQDATRPTSWPLTQRGFVTQRLLAGSEGYHPGLDIAVPMDTYIRAAGGGVVTDVGEDQTYGRFIQLDHGAGYKTLYGHASETFVAIGDRVRRNEVIALSGSTGRSTAPHLHFEVFLDGAAVDPLTMVHQPR